MQATDSHYKAVAAADKIARQIAALDKMQWINDFGPHILKIMAGVDFQVWHLLDEKPGLFGYMDDRFYMLRQVRNDPVWGRQMFDGFTG
jgi:hypothetical protein